MMSAFRDKYGAIFRSGGPFASPLAQRIGMGVLLVALISVPLIVQTRPLDLQEGQPAPRTVRADRAVSYVDEPATELARKQASDDVQPVYVFAPDAADEAASNLEAAAPGALSEFDAASAASAAAIAKEALQVAMTERFTAQDMPAAITQARTYVASRIEPGPLATAVSDLVERALRPTLVFDLQATQAARNAAASRVEAVVIVKQPGENIVVEGELVTTEDLEIVSRLGLLDQSRSPAALGAIVLLAALVIFSVGLFVWRYDVKVWERRRHLFIMGTLLVGMVWTTRFLLWWRPEIPVFVLPIPLAAMLATVLVGTRAGALVAVMTTLASVMLGFTSPAAVVGVLSWSLASIVAMDFMKDRRSITFVGLFVTAYGAIASLASALAVGTPIAQTLTALAYGAFGGMAASVLGYGLLPFFEYVFNVTTDVRLLELANPAAPLMRDLMLKAPGTYSHSVMTGNLAEAAAEKIGANPVLARVGSYYHDIGKLRRPDFFVENQTGGNPHDETAPSMSALIITAHVSQGIELAEEHKLPREIVAIIRQHHGTSLVSYFFNKAREHDETVYEADFRYTGECPKSREAALVMLADSCEAAVRGLSKPTPTRIGATVRSVVDGKVADTQLNDSDLTLANIEDIIGVYSRMLSNVYHRRVAYPAVTPKGHEHAHPAHESSRS